VSISAGSTSNMHHLHITTDSFEHDSVISTGARGTMITKQPIEGTITAQCNSLETRALS